MRLPSEAELRSKEHRSLWEHDNAESAGGRGVDAAMYRLRLAAVIEVVENYVRPGATVLDAACAQGNIAQSLTGKYRTVGLDLRHGFLTYAALKSGLAGEPSWVTGSLDAVPFRPGSMDAVVLGEVVEHAAYPERMVAQAADLLHPGGVMVVTTPNGGRALSPLPTMADIPDRTVLESRQFEPDADGHLFLLTKAEVVLLGTAAGLKLLEHRFLQSPPISGWPRWQALATRVPMGMRSALDRPWSRSPLAAKCCQGQLAVFRK